MIDLVVMVMPFSLQDQFSSIANLYWSATSHHRPFAIRLVNTGGQPALDGAGVREKLGGGLGTIELAHTAVAAAAEAEAAGGLGLGGGDVESAVGGGRGSRLGSGGRAAAAETE